MPTCPVSLDKSVDRISDLYSSVQTEFASELHVFKSVCSSGFWYDSRLRCDVVDLYYELYGKKKPVSVPLPELAALRPQKVEKPRGEKDVSARKTDRCIWEH